MRVRVVVLALCLYGVLACAQTLSKRPAQPEPNKARQARDTKIHEQAEKYLAGHDEFKKIKVSVEDRVVTLKGTVDLPSDRVWLAARMKGIADVSSVNNQLVLDPPAEPDLVLRDRIKRSLLPTHFSGVTFTVHEGLVKLSGSVRTRGDASRALSLVMSTPGVREVESEIKMMENY